MNLNADYNLLPCGFVVSKHYAQRSGVQVKWKWSGHRPGATAL